MLLSKKKTPGPLDAATRAHLAAAGIVDVDAEEARLGAACGKTVMVCDVAVGSLGSLMTVRVDDASYLVDVDGNLAYPKGWRAGRIIDIADM